MNTMKICSSCHKPLEANAPGGLCPECLIQAGLGTGADLGPDSQPANGGTPFVAPALEELVRLFPELEILGVIGQGGMGAVYKARQKTLDCVLALKILPPGIGKEPTFAERFTREAKALARLNHTGIVTLYEFGQADGLFFFLMEFVDGTSLRHLLGVERISAREALAIVPQICDALQYAHDQGIVHRDIKPENILLDRRGRVKVADFGLAKLVETPGETRPGTAEDSTSASVLTKIGKVMGTPQYMAPEQWDHPAEVDHRADIYSLGVVLYQMLTGELPGKPIAPPSHTVRVDVRLDEVVLRALEKEPERRYQHASEVKTAVETIAASDSATAKTSKATARIAAVADRSAKSLMPPHPLPLGKAVLGGSIVAVLVFLTFLVVTFVLPKSFVGIARVSVEKPEPLGQSDLDAGVLHTEMGVMRSPPVLSNVIQRLHLEQRWGQRFGNHPPFAQGFGDHPPLAQRQCLNLLQRQIVVERTPKAGLVIVSAYSNVPAEAAELANAIAEDYRAFRAQLRVTLVDRAIPPLRPVRPDKPLNLTLGAVGGLALGLLVGGLWLLAAARRHDSAGTPAVTSPAGLRWVRWPAWILGMLWLLMFLVVFIAEGSPPLPTQPGAVQIQYIALALMLAGVVFGWWRDGLAALLLLGGWALFHIAEGHVPTWSLIHVAAVLAVLFAASWAGRRRTLAAGLVAFPVFFALLLNLGCFHSRVKRDTLTASSHNPPPGDQVTFGPEAKGLRAAVELSSSHGVFALGEPIEVLFHIRNTSSTNIYVAGGRWRQDDAHCITIEDQQGRRIPAQHVYHSVRTPIQRNLLLPGESAVLHSSGLAFLGKDDDGKKFTQPVGNYVTVSPGRYTVRYRLHFPDLLTTGFPQSFDWQGDLDTAPVTVEVTAARQSAAAPAFSPVIERVIRSESNHLWALNLASGNLVISTPEQPLDFRVSQADSLRSAKVDLSQPFEANTPDTVKALDMRLVALGTQAWDIPASEVVAQLEKEAAVQILRSEVFLNGSAFYAFSTREGAKGVLQILKDTGPAKLRYKLLQPAANVLATPREVVTEWLWRVKAGTRETWDLTTRSNNVGTGPSFTGLWDYDRIRPLHQLGNEEQAMVVSNPFNDDAGQTHIFYAVLRKRDGQWLVDGHNYVSPSKASSLLKGFAMNPGITFDVLAAEVVGEWRAVCDSTISMAADGTGKQLRVGPGGSEPGAKPEPFKWEVSGSTLRRHFADRQENLEIIWMDDNELQFRSPNQSRWAAWWRKPQVDPPQPASATNAASVSPTNAPTQLGSSATPPLSSSVTVERVIDFDVERKTAYLDLDTGEYVDPGTNGFFTDGTPGGVDLMSRSIESNFDARWGINMSIVPVEPVRWEATPEEIRMAVDSARPQGKTRLSGGRSTNTWFFQTSEGGRGVLQFMPPKTGDDRSQIRLRYRLVLASCNQTDIQRSATSITDRDNDVSTVLIRGRIVTGNFDVDVQFAFQRPNQASLLLLDHADQTPLHWATTGRLLLYDPIRGVIVNIATPDGAPSFRLALNDGQLEFEFGHNKGVGAKSNGQDRFVLALSDFVRTASGAPQLKPLDARTVFFTGVSPQGNQVRAWVKPGLKFGVRRLELQAATGAGVFLEQIAVNPQIPAQMFVLPAVESLGGHVKQESPSLSREAFFKLTTQWMDALTTRQAIRKPEQRAAVERQIGAPVDWTAVTKADMSTSAILRDALEAMDAAAAGKIRSPGSR